MTSETNVQIIELSRVQVGKHGHPKCLITASDIFTEQRFEDILPSSHICDVSTYPEPFHVQMASLDTKDRNMPSL
jgi:translation elongation factor P/translation initiation factor 5A